MKDISVIIPFKNTVKTLPRLFDSIPNTNNIEIILVENSDNPLTRDEIGIDREYILLNAPASRYAGGARNVGIEASTGRWLIFADSDDFFAPFAFDVFNGYIDSNIDLIYFKVYSVYDDTLKESDRHLMFNSLVDSYISGAISTLQAKLFYLVPWGKMIKRQLIIDNEIRFDEVLAANDVMFSTLTGFYANSFKVDSDIVYTVTTRKGSLANRLDKDVTLSRYSVALRRNLFLKENNLNEYQGSIMIYIYRAFRLGMRVFLSFIMMVIKYKQNIFIGWKNWLRTRSAVKENEKHNKRYISK